MSRYNLREFPEPKIHLHRDQGGATIRGTSRKFANTLCKMNSDVPTERITTDPGKVTCKICLRDARFPKAGATIAPPAYQFRHRQNWRGKLVLQISEALPTNYDPRDPWDLGPRNWATRWRDARVEDLPPGVLPGR